MSKIKMRYAQDYKPGEIYELGSYQVTQQEIIEFSKKYDPFPFHVDEQAAKKTVFNGIISSGWLTGLVWLRMMHESFLCHATTLGSPGHEEMLWPKPVRPGDCLTGQVEIKESKVSKSKPDLGFVRYTSKLKNQNGEDVFITTSTMIVKPRPAKNE
jgi:acyl dehydratase